jgi:predicted nucleic acid-binding protein
MKLVAIDCNIYDELLKNEGDKLIINKAIDSGDINIVISPTVVIELVGAEKKHGVKLSALIPYETLDESTSFPPLIPGKFIVGGDVSKFEELKGNIKTAKRSKDPRIMATLLHHEVELFVTQNRSDFRSQEGIKVLNFSEFIGELA